MHVRLLRTCANVLEEAVKIKGFQSAFTIHETLSIGEMNKTAIAREDQFRSQVTFSAAYSLSDNTLEPQIAREQTFDLVTRILELFDTTLVRIGGGGWERTEEPSYTMAFNCKCNGTNRSPTGTRKSKKQNLVAGLDQKSTFIPAPAPAPRRVSMSTPVVPCCTYVCTMFYCLFLGLCCVLDSACEITNLASQAYVRITPTKLKNLTSGTIRVTIAQLHSHSTCTGPTGKHITCCHVFAQVSEIIIIHLFVDAIHTDVFQQH